MTAAHTARVAVLIAAGLAVGVAAQPALPTPSGAVNDFANLLTEADEARLARRLDDVERATTAEIAVVTVPSLDGLTVEEYATRLFAAWGIGQAGTDNGVLVLVAPNQREMRIEVGYGLEGVLPDGLAGQIVRETFLPAFRDGDYPRGIVAGTERVAAVVERNQPLTDAERQALASSGSGSSNDALLPFVLIPFLGLFVTIGSGFAGAGLRTKAIGPVIFGVFFAGVPLLMSLLSGIRMAIWILLGVAIVFLVVGWRMGGRPGARGSLRGSPGSSKSGWVWGGGGASGSSGRSSGSSRSSGGFSGGRSGGGGASGRW
ncbi:MAG: YgcG family protein [Vicinamibacterales bacterium]